MSLITEEHKARFRTYVDRIGANGLRLDCLTPEERQDMTDFMELWLYEQEVEELVASVESICKGKEGE